VERDNPQVSVTVGKRKIFTSLDCIGFILFALKLSMEQNYFDLYLKGQTDECLRPK